jgi:hypothetical protein
MRTDRSHLPASALALAFLVAACAGAPSPEAPPMERIIQERLPQIEVTAVRADGMPVQEDGDGDFGPAEMHLRGRWIFAGPCRELAGDVAREGDTAVVTLSGRSPEGGCPEEGDDVRYDLALTWVPAEYARVRVQVPGGLTLWEGQIDWVMGGRISPSVVEVADHAERSGRED